MIMGKVICVGFGLGDFDLMLVCVDWLIWGVC